ncbi:MULTISPECIES: lysostaphin resistance A-like protein [unclassified Sinorhizobium]|uniref:CPBP family intramembrane glutamic endopeptidase n=1 Tax=unclassified Sinorhizobium TaxID=2613772 RepID=UPI0035264D22
MSVIVLLVWMAITSLGGLVSGSSDKSIIDVVSQGIVWPIAFAAAFLLIVLAVFRWNDVGFKSANALKSIRLMWLPLVYVSLFVAMILAMGLPPASAVIYILINTIFVGISEELMFRGILFSGLRSRLALWPSIWLCSAVFGLIHVLNVVQTGHVILAVLQAIAAFMTGMMFMALRIRTGSLYPVILLHTTWDCLSLLAVVKAGGMQSGEALPPVIYIAPLLVLPNLLYALYLLRAKALQSA